MATTRAASFEGPGPDAVYAENLKAGKFRIQHCNECGKNFFYPRALCQHCGSADWGWIDATGKGTVYSTSVVRLKPEDGPDYNIALIDLDEGPRMMSRVTDIPGRRSRSGCRSRPISAISAKSPWSCSGRRGGDRNGTSVARFGRGGRRRLDAVRRASRPLPSRNHGRGGA